MISIPFSSNAYLIFERGIEQSRIVNNNSVIKSARSVSQPKCRFPRRTKAKDMEVNQLQARREYDRMRQVEANLRELERNSMKSEVVFAQDVRFEENQRQRI